MMGASPGSVERPYPIASVIIPAHNEQKVIGRCLDALLDDARPGEFEVVVVANGCTDATAELARRHDPAVKVVELERASKVAALNAGDQVASVFPRAYLDADIEMSAASLREVVSLLDQGGQAYCAAPEMHLRLDDRPWFIRSFFRVFRAQPYARDRLVGNGVYVLSRAGRARFDEFPEITADDLFVRNMFGLEERATATGATFRIHPPRSLNGLLAIRERAYRGNAEYSSLGYTSRAEATFDVRALGRQMMSHPIDASVYLAINALAKLRLRLRRRPAVWERDDSGRA